jgi:hypothetical protein
MRERCLPSALSILLIRIEADAMTFRRHCEERSDEAIHVSACGNMDCFATLAMTEAFPLAERKRAALGRSSASLNSMLPSRVPGERVGD